MVNYLYNFKWVNSNGNDIECLSFNIIWRNDIISNQNICKERCPLFLYRKKHFRALPTQFFFWEHSILFTQDWMRTFTFRMKYCILNGKMLRVKNSHFCTKCKNHIMIVHFINTNDSFALDAINHSNKNRTVKFGFSKELVYFHLNITRET